MTTDFTPEDLERIRREFPVLTRSIGEHDLVYLDSANTSQKPQAVLDAIYQHDSWSNANVARAMHTLGNEATEAYESARKTIAEFIGAKQPQEVIFTKNATEALNLCAHTLGAGLKTGDEVVVSVLEHHSNIVSWQLACQRSGATLRWFDIDDHGRLDLQKAADDRLINERTKVVSLAWISNVMGTVNPIAEIANQAHDVGAVLVVDAAQGVPHRRCNVAELGADFVAFTGHKMCGPTGIGVLWGRYELLASLPPFLGGGEMIEVVTMQSSTYANPPHRFEAGTPPITQAIGLAAAVRYLGELGMDRIALHDQALTGYALRRLQEIPGLSILGPTDNVDRGATWAFTLAGIHPHDVMQVLDSHGIAVRGGHHCARPLHARLGVQSSIRASGYFYTTQAEIDALVAGLHSAINYFGGVR